MYLSHISVLIINKYTNEKKKKRKPMFWTNSLDQFEDYLKFEHFFIYQNYVTT